MSEVSSLLHTSNGSLQVRVSIHIESYFCKPLDSTIVIVALQGKITNIAGPSSQTNMAADTRTVNESEISREALVQQTSLQNNFIGFPTIFC